MGPGPADMGMGMGTMKAQYPDLAAEDLQRMRKDLLNAGAGLLFMGFVFSGAVALVLGIRQYRPCSGYGYALGGLLALLLLLRRPGNPVRVGHRAIPRPEEWSPYEVALWQLIRQLRSRWVLVASGIFPLLIGFVYGGGTLLSLSPLKQCMTNASTLGFMPFGLTHVVAMAGGFDFLYVRWKLGEDVRFK